MKEEISAAIGAHGMWKSRLRTAIDTGKIDTPIATISADNQCAFGKWLHGPTIPAGVKGSEDHRKIVSLHADFHRIAAKVADLSTQGKKDEARKMMDMNGEYASASAKLTSAMMEWQKKAV